MNQKPQCISLPLTQQRWQFILLAGIFLPFALFLFCLGTSQLHELDLMSGLILCIFVLMFFFFGAASLIQCFLWVHFVPEGVAVTLGSRTLYRIPAEQLRLVCQVQGLGKSSNITRTVLSRRPVEELAALREKQMARNFYMRSNIPVRKRKPDWQQKFVEEYLRRRFDHVLVGYLDPDLLWLEHMPELDAVLEALYGHLDILRMDFPVPIRSSPWTDLDSRHFCRGCHKPGSRDVLQFICYVFILSPLVLLVIPLSGLPVAAVMLGLVSVIALLVWLLDRGSYDVIHLEDDGIRVTAGNRVLRTIPASDFRFIVRCDSYNALFGQGFLAVSDRSPDEVVAREAARMERSARGRRILAAWRQLPGWEERLLVRACCRALDLAGCRARDVQLMANVPQRIEMLQSLYPDIRWIHADAVGQIRS